MNKFLACGLAALFLTGFSACGDDGDDDSPAETDAGVEVTDGGGTEADGGADAGEAADGGDGDAGAVDAGPFSCDQCGPGKICKDGVECADSDYGKSCNGSFVERCDGNVAVWCNGRGEITSSECGSDLTCGFAVDDLDGWGAWGVDCMAPCDRPGDGWETCGDGDYEGFGVFWTCSTLSDGSFGAYWSDEEECRHGCDEEEGACIRLDPDEGRWCTATGFEDVEAYAQHCTGNAAVFCYNGAVQAVDCEDWTCHSVQGVNYADCYQASEECPEAGEKSGKECFVESDGDEYVVSYTCRATETEGVNVWKMDTDAGEYELCEVNCVPGVSADAEGEADAGQDLTAAHCGVLDGRIGTSCTQEDKKSGYVCGDGGIIMACYSNGSELLWHVTQNCGAQGKSCVRNEDGTADCFGNEDACGEGDAPTYECVAYDFGTSNIIASAPRTCTLMSDGKWHWVEGALDFCDGACDESTGRCE